MPSSPSCQSRALVIYQDGRDWSQVEGLCRRYFREICNPELEFLSLRTDALEVAKPPPGDFSLVLFWLSKDLTNEQVIMDWLDRWAEERSTGDGGTLICLTEGEDPNWKLRLWELFTESIGAWGGIEFHCHRCRSGEVDPEFVTSSSRSLKVDCSQPKLEPCSGPC